MSGSASPFGQPSTSPFGIQPNPFGQSSSSTPSTPAFGAAAPSQGFGTSTPAFGAQSSPFGGSSASGSFESAAKPSSLGSSNQQSQPAFGNNVFGSSASGAPSQPSFGVTNTQAIGSSTTPTLGSTSAPAFSSTPNLSFGCTGTAFGSGNTSGFGAGRADAFGFTTTLPFRAASASAFGGSTTPPISFTFKNSSQAFGQSTSSPFGLHSSSGAITPIFGGCCAHVLQPCKVESEGKVESISAMQAYMDKSHEELRLEDYQRGYKGATTQTSGGFCAQVLQRGSRATPYLATADEDSCFITDLITYMKPYLATAVRELQGKVKSISAMQAYMDKSHELLRWEDYQRGDKGGPNPAGNPFGPSQTFGQTAANPFTSSTPPEQTNVFAPNSSPFVNTSPATTATTPFGSAPATTPSLVGPSLTQTSPFFVTLTLSFGGASSSATGSSSIFGPTPGQGQSSLGISAFGSQSSPLFQTSSPSLGIGQTPTLSNPFNTTSNAFPTSGFQNSTPTTAAQFSLSQSTPFQPSLPAQPIPNSGFNFSNAAGQTQAGGASVPPPVAVTSPFGTLPATLHISIGNGGTSPSIQHGISSIPVVDKPSPVGVSPILTPRHLSRRRAWLRS